MKICKKNIVILLVIFYLPISLSFTVVGCKDIIACGNSTDGDYNLLLKVRDPSRPGLQVLTIVPNGYEYEFNHPWTGKKINFIVDNKYIGIASKDDVIPNIVKSGMVLTDKGLAFGDADTNSNWINPTKYAWDDFDWIRYSCEKAANINEAVELLTEDVVDKYHAPGVTENLFVIGPDNGYIIEADAFQYSINELTNNVGVMSNYPKNLWKSQILKSYKISSSFDFNKTDYFKEGDNIKLNSFYGVKILEINDKSIVARQIPIFKINLNMFIFVGEKIEINLGERKTVGDFSLEVLEIKNNSVKVRLCNKFKAWEDKMLNYISPEYGNINIKDMMNWSRLKSSDLDGLRGMCEGFYKDEAVSIYKIPKNNYDVLSIGWFSPSQACSSIFVPFHNSNYDIYDAYENGDAAQLCQNLFQIYGYDNLSCFEKVENVFLYETEIIETVSLNNIDTKDIVSEILTIFDMSVQKQAYLLETTWLELNNINNSFEKKLLSEIINRTFEANYSNSLINMKNSILEINNFSSSFQIIDNIITIALNICESRIDIANIIGKQSDEALEYYILGEEFIENFEYELGFDYLIICYLLINNLLFE
jgi:hypothetical protein